MWDRKRQTIWLATAVVVATFVVYRDSYDEQGRFDTGYFILLEAVFLAIIALMFYVYSRQKS
jgi:cell division protein FtsW (lipid II flippase)